MTLSPRPRTDKAIRTRIRPTGTDPGPVKRLHEILVVGEGSDARAVYRALSKLRLLARQCATMQEAREAKTQATMAVVLVDPIPDAELPDAVDELAGEAGGGPIPVFVVFVDAYSDRMARRLYEAGAAAVFEWPFEATALPRMISELLGALPAKGDKRGDAALSRAIRVRLRTAGAPDVDVNVAGGTVALRGEIGSYWKKQRLVQMLGHVPGVVAVLADGLGVVESERPDREVARHVRNVLRSASHSMFETVSVDVDAGNVALAGVVPTHDELERVEALVGNVDGVRSVQNLITVSAAATKRSRGLAKRLQEGVDSTWPNAEVTVTVFGGVTVVRGHVHRLSEKRAIERHVRSAGGIERVVNKVVVAP